MKVEVEVIGITMRTHCSVPSALSTIVDGISAVLLSAQSNQAVNAVSLGFGSDCFFSSSNWNQKP